MKTIVIAGALLMTTGILPSCGQIANGPKIKTIAANFSKDKVPSDLSHLSRATFAAGCFWHEETLFESIKGVITAVPGYAGGTARNPSYEDVETGGTGHAETVDIYYDSTVVSFPTLLKSYFESMDPTQVDGQGPDTGPQYRSIAFYRNDKEKDLIMAEIQRMKASGKYHSPIAVQVTPFTKFWEAEDYHRGYINTHTDNPYVANYSIREISRFQKEHPELIKPGHNFYSGK